MQGSQTRLRERVREMLGESREPAAAEVEAAAVLKADVLLEVDPLDSTHLFYEELRRIGRALREVRPEDLTGEDLDALIPVLDELGTVLSQIERRNRRKDQNLQKLTT
jgi:phosphoenolpyruvate carboxylase